MTPVTVAPAARRDVRDILRWSDSQFGRQARDRYRRFIERACVDLRSDPARPGVQRHQDMAADHFLYHLRHGRSLSPADRVASPRHFLAFRHRGDHIEIVRILHDAMNLPSHLNRG
ncbi:MAG TPA: type II toxin-antitoxin system RelE/ParE family toxin [Caulobacteraceae bacterium]